MTNQEIEKPEEYRKKFKDYDLVIDKGTIFVMIMGIIMIILFMLFMFYLAGVFK